ncbi:MAG: type II toxin-antitoxin system HigB family toxin [Candidatus Tectomicrobia bacterium]
MRRLREFWTIHPDAEGPLRSWYRVVKQAHWQRFPDVRAIYGSADQGGKFTVFNIAGNTYRLIAVIHFNTGRLYVRQVLTHTAYDRGTWKTDSSRVSAHVPSQWRANPMSLATIYGEAQDTYLALIRTFPLRPIRSEAELDEAMAVIDALVVTDPLEAAAADYLAVLSALVEQYEAEAHSISPASDAEMLRHLIDAKAVSQVQVAQETGIVESTISAVLAGKRHLTREHIGKLAHYFHVSPSVFEFGE